MSEVNTYLQKIMQEKLFLLLFLALTMMFGLFAYNNYLQFENTTVDTYNKVNRINNQQGYDTAYAPISTQTVATHAYLVPVTSHSNYEIQLMSQDLNSQVFYIELGNVNLLPNPKLRTKIISSDEVEPTIQKGKILLATPDQISSTMRTVPIDGQTIWDKDFNSETYPFKKSGDINFDSSKNQSILALGEFIPARAVDRLSLNKNNNYTYLFSDFEEDIQNADLSLILLENSLSGDPFPCTGCMKFVGDAQNAEGLATLGFDFVSLAGNHALDGGTQAARDTVDILRENGLSTSGTGDFYINHKTTDNLKFSDASNYPAIKEMNGKTFGMLSADDIASYYWQADNFFGTNSYSSRSAGGHIKPDEEKIQNIRVIKDKFSIEFLIIYMSWGIEYTDTPNKHQRDLAKLLVDNGADLILGSHPHWVQSFEIYKDVPIIYSLGNFIFDQTHTEKTRQGTTVKINVYKDNITNIEFTPFKSCGYHQTKNNLTDEFLNKTLTLEDIKTIDEREGCVYWMPLKLNKDKAEYKEIISTIYKEAR